MATKLRAREVRGKCVREKGREGSAAAVEGGVCACVQGVDKEHERMNTERMKSFYDKGLLGG
jgi:hypothetical protein